MTDMKFLLILGLLLTSIRAQAKPVAPAFLIVPGQSIGKIKLGDDRETVRKKMGVPFKTSNEKLAAYEKSSDPKALNPYKKVKERDVVIDEWWRPKAVGRLKAIYDAGRVIQIQVSLSGYATEYGLAPNSPMKQVEKRYRSPRIVEFGFGSNDFFNETFALVQTQDYVAEGLAVLTGLYDEGSRPWGIYTIFVHERNRLVFTGSSGLN